MEKLYNKILLEYKSIPRNKTNKTFMEICGFPHYENVCSNILQFYLNPQNEHGLQDLILNSLLNLVDKNFKFDKDFEEIEVHREYTTSANKRLDLLIITENYVVGIENKIFHHLHNDLADYNETILFFCSNLKKPISIVLSLNKLTSKEDIDKLKDNNFINVTYEQLFNNIKNDIGRYIKNSNLSYISHLTDFIKSIENLTCTTMENIPLIKFFENNGEHIQELMDSFNEYKKYLNQKIIKLKDIISQYGYESKLWIYNDSCLVYDCTINSRYKIAVDTCIGIRGWEIQLFGRDLQSNEFLFNTMCQDEAFLPKPYNSCQKGERLIYEKYDTETSISIISQNLSDLIFRIENY